MDHVTESYQKPFHLFHYNRPKRPELPKIRKIKFTDKPKIPARSNNATKLRDKAIKMYALMDEPIIDYGALTEQTSQTVYDPPEYLARGTKTSQFRYKWARDVPVVPCRFTEYVLMYKKPPFTFERNQYCGQFRLRRMEIASPQPESEPEVEVEALPLFPSILQ